MIYLKGRRRMKTVIKRSLIMTLVAALLIGTFSISADAVMKRKLKYQASTNKIRVIDKKASKVKKGTTILTIPKGNGYIKFVAPETKTYKFTFSNIKDKKSSIEQVNISPLMKYDPKPQYCVSVDVSTKGGIARSLSLLCKDYPVLEKNRKIERYTFLKSRTAKIKLNKGDIIYFEYTRTSRYDKYYNYVKNGKYVRLGDQTCKLVIK